MIFLDRDKSRASTIEGARAPSEESAAPVPLVPSKELVYFIRNGKICYGSSFGMACILKGCWYVHNYVPPGYYRHVDGQRQKTSTPLDDGTMLKQAKSELAA